MEIYFGVATMGPADQWSSCRWPMHRLSLMVEGTEYSVGGQEKKARYKHVLPQSTTNLKWCSLANER